MTSLHDYENGLDELDTRLHSSATGIHCDYGGGYFFKFSSINSFHEVLPIAKDLSLLLLDEKASVNSSYLVKRFIRLATDRVGGGHVNEEFLKHDLMHMTLVDPEAVSIDRSESNMCIRFLNANGQDFLRFTRKRGRWSSQRAGPVRIERLSSFNMQDVHFLEITSAEIVLTPNHLILDASSARTWRAANGGATPTWPGDVSMRFAIKHSFASDALHSLISEFHVLFEGLSCQVLSFEEMEKKYKAA